MSYFLIILALSILAIFGCISISQSYASAKQAQAVIETNQTAQLALSGQIALSILFSMIALILIIALLVLVYLLIKKAPARHIQEKSASMPLRLPVFLEEDEEELPKFSSDWGW